MRIRYIISLLYLSLIQTGISQSFIEANPSDVGFIGDRLNRIDNFINKSINDGEIPGAVALIAKNGKIVYHKSFGYADIDAQKKIMKNSIFRIASMTKAITTVGVMILYERGHFMLNDPISKYIPEFKNPEIFVKSNSSGSLAKTVSSKREIRIIDLLNHTSGLSYPSSKNDLQKVYKEAGIIDGMTAEKTVLKNQMNLLATLPLLFEPSSNYQYGLSYDLLGYLCEVISGKSFDRYLNDEIFKPLKMHDTHFYIPDNKKDQLVNLYSWSTDNGLTVSKGDESSLKLDNPNFPIEGAKSYFSGGGGLSATAYDYGRFIQMLLNNGELEKVRIISRKSVELIQRARVDWDNDGQFDAGFGFYITNDIAMEGELGSDGTYMWTGAFHTLYWIDPKENLIGVFMSQLRPSNSAVRYKFQTLVYQALK